MNGGDDDNDDRHRRNRKQQPPPGGYYLPTMNGKKKKIGGAEEGGDSSDVVALRVPASPAASPSPSLDGISASQQGEEYDDEDDENDHRGLHPRRHASPRQEQQQNRHPIQQLRRSVQVASVVPQPAASPAGGSGSSTALVAATDNAAAASANIPASTGASGRQVLVLILRQHPLVAFWALATLAMTSSFVVLILPSWTAVFVLVSALASSAAFARAAALALSQQQDLTFRRLLIAALERRILFPDWVRRSLVESSLHDWLAPNPDVDWNRIWNENRHLLLYFLPLEADRLNVLLEQLPPRHARQLREPGFLARVLLGDEWQQHQQQRQQQGRPRSRQRRQHRSNDGNNNTAVPAIVSEQGIHQMGGSVGTSTARRRLDLHEDESAASDLGLDGLSPDDLVVGAGPTDQQTTRMARATGLAPPSAETATSGEDAGTANARGLVVAMNGDDDDGTTSSSSTLFLTEREEYAEEERLLAEAVSAIVFGFCVPFAQAAAGGITASWLRPASRVLWSAGRSLSFTAAGLGMLGYYSRHHHGGGMIGGFFGRSRNNDSWAAIIGTGATNWISVAFARMTSSDFVWTAATLGVGTLGIAWVTQVTARVLAPDDVEEEEVSAEASSSPQRRQSSSSRRRRSLSLSAKKRKQQKDNK